MNESRKLIVISDDEIRAIIDKVAQASINGHFLLGDVEAALLKKGIQPKSVQWREILDATYQRDLFVNQHPYSAAMKVEPPQKENPLIGMPTLNKTGSVVSGKYRKGGIKHHGISEQPPKDLNPK